MRRPGLPILAVCLLALPAAGHAADKRQECLSIDGQVTLSLRPDPAENTLVIRIPESRGRDAHILRLDARGFIAETLSVSEPTVLTKGCEGASKGTVAVRETTTVVTRRVRLSFPDGAAFPESVTGRGPEGDTIERDLNCTRVRTGMVECP